MIFIAITKVKNKFWALVRLAFVIALLGLLVPPLFNLASQAVSGSWPKDDPPTGQPMRVDQKQEAQEGQTNNRVKGQEGATQGTQDEHVGHGANPQENGGLFEEFVIKLRQYYDPEN